MGIRSAAGSLPSAALALALALGAAACNRGGDNANNANARANANAANTASVPASEDAAVKNKTEANLSKYGVTGVTVEVSGGVVTLKGDVPEAKFQDAVKAANEAGAKRVMNQLNKK